MSARPRRILMYIAAGIVVALPAAWFLYRLAAENNRVAKCQSLVEEHLRQGRDAAFFAGYGRFLRMEGRGHEDPPFMSPIGDCLIARRTAHFERSSVRMRILAPGLSSSMTDQIPRFSGDQNEIIVGFESRTNR